MCILLSVMGKVMLKQCLKDEQRCHMKAQPDSGKKYQEIEEHNDLENNKKPNSTKTETLKFGS